MQGSLRQQALFKDRGLFGLDIAIGVDFAVALAAEVKFGAHELLLGSELSLLQLAVDLVYRCAVVGVHG